MKYLFDVPDMSCGHCKAHIEAALRTWGKASSWNVDLEKKTVQVESAESAHAIAQVIQDEGYSATLV